MPKNKLVASLLALFLGSIGFHRFYLEQWWGIFYLLFCWTGIPTIVSFVESIVFLLTSDQEWSYKHGTYRR